MKKKVAVDWSELPYDIVAIVGKKLSLTDHLSFRWVCAHWRSASKTCYQLNFQQPKSKSLWLIMFSTPTQDDGLMVGDLSNGCVYKLDDDTRFLYNKGTKVLLSSHGWLLVVTSNPLPTSLFFYNPFSQARIHLPWCDALSNIHDFVGRRKRRYFPVFAISTPPTSSDCVLWSIRLLAGRDHNFEINMIAKGETDWTTERRYKMFIRHDGGQHIRSGFFKAVFFNGFFYAKARDNMFLGFVYFPYKPVFQRLNLMLVRWNLLNATEDVLTYSVREILTRTPTSDARGSLNFTKAEREDGDQNCYWIDTIPLCVYLEIVQDGKLVGWHFRDYKECVPGCGGSIWIEPKWIPASTNLSWASRSTL